MSAENIKHEGSPPQYADEVLCANWSPLAPMLAEPMTKVPLLVPESDAEAFLTRLYLSQRP